MKRSSKELKRIARDMLNNRYRVPMGAFVTASCITAAIEIPFSLSLGRYPSILQIVTLLLAEYLVLLISQVLNAGVLLVHLNMARNKEYKVTTLFAPLQKNTERYFLAAFLLSLVALACCIPTIGGSIFFFYTKNQTLGIFILVLTGILTIVLFIITALHYNFVFFYLLDEPEIKATAAFKKSRHLAKNNKCRLFYLMLSFMGLNLLILCSFGLSALWVRPYKNQTMVNFYLDCTGELNRIPVRDYADNSSRFTNSNF